LNHRNGMTEQEKAENYTSSELETILEQLTPDQLRFVVARQQHRTDKAAAEALDISTQVVYRWPDIVKEAVRLMAYDGLVTALYIRRNALAKAMMVKVNGLDSKEERIRQSVATEVIEWEVGKATQKNELTGRDGGPIAFDSEAWREKRKQRLADVAAIIAVVPDGNSDDVEEAVEVAEVAAANRRLAEIERQLSALGRGQ